MKKRVHKLKNRDSAFSLVELMVVISIISLLVALSLPQIVFIKIKAARTEMHLVMRTMFTLSNAYHAEESRYPPNFSYGISEEDGDLVDYCSVSDGAHFMGFKMAECEKLRYYYSYSGMGGYGNSIDMNFRLYSSILARSVYFKEKGDPPARSGISAPTRLCKVPNSNYEYYYRDQWTMFENQSVQPYLNQIINDALKSCL